MDSAPDNLRHDLALRPTTRPLAVVLVVLATWPPLATAAGLWHVLGWPGSPVWFAVAAVAVVLLGGALDVMLWWQGPGTLHLRATPDSLWIGLRRVPVHEVEALEVTWDQVVVHLTGGRVLCSPPVEMDDPYALQQSLVALLERGPEPSPQPDRRGSVHDRMAVLRDRHRQRGSRPWETWTADGVELVLGRVGAGFGDWVRGRREVVVRVRSGGLEVDGTWFEAVEIEDVRLELGRVVVDHAGGQWTGPPMVVAEPSHVQELLEQVVRTEAERVAEQEGATAARSALEVVRAARQQREP